MQAMTGGPLEKLFFSLSIIDQVTKPSTKISKSLREVEKAARAGFMSIGKGALTIGTVSAAMLTFTASARDFNKALNEVSALGVAQKEIVKLGDASLDFSSKYGGAASEVVQAGYDIQSSISGLVDGELAKFTYNSAVLAKATKATTGTITGYVSTMAGVFEKDMNRIGKGQWVEQLTGKTAKAVQMFRTTGSEMQAAFANLGAVGSTQGVGMDEQMSVLGMLQQVTGSGSMAATQYRAFINGATEAQQKLGLSFVDSQGKLLPMAGILERIKGKFGDTIDAAESLQLKKAFGSVEAVSAVTGLLNKTDALKTNITELGKIKGMGPALDMAAAQVDPLDKFQATIESIRITLGQTLLPAINIVLDVMSYFLRIFRVVLNYCPPLRWAIAGVALAISALGTALGTLWIISGIVKLHTAFILKLRILWAWCLKNSAATYSMTTAQRVHAVATWMWQGVISKATAAINLLRLNLLWNKAVQIASAAGTWIITTAQAAMALGFWGSCAAVWGFTAALLACPITWIVIGVMAIIGAVVALVVYWDKVVAALGIAWDWMKSAFGSVVDFFLEYWQWGLALLLGPVGLVVKAIITYWDQIKGAFSFMVDYILGLWNKVTGTLGKVGNFLSKIPGLGWLKSDVAVTQNVKSVQQHKFEKPVVPSVASARKVDVPAGGIRNSQTNNTNNYGGVTINTSAAVGPGEMEDMWSLQYG